jgi:hypothetical protein
MRKLPLDFDSAAVLLCGALRLSHGRQTMTRQNGRDQKWKAIAHWDLVAQPSLALAFC